MQKKLFLKSTSKKDNKKDSFSAHQIFVQIKGLDIEKICFYFA